MYKKLSIVLIACVFSFTAARTDTFDIEKRFLAERGACCH